MVIQLLQRKERKEEEKYYVPRLNNHPFFKFIGYIFMSIT